MATTQEATAQQPAVGERRIGDVLEPIPPDDPRWSRMDGLKAKHERRNTNEGSGFAMQTYGEDAASVGTITKGYSKVRSTDPKLQHPTDPDLLRQFLPVEHARIKGVPEHLIDGLSNTVAHEILGQGIVYAPFQDVGHHVGNTLNQMVGRAAVPMSSRQEVAVPVIKGAELVTEEVAQMASEILATLKLAATDKSQYVGRLVAAGDGLVIQDVGKRTGVVHRLNEMDGDVRVGAAVKVAYEGGRARVTEIREREQLALSL